MEAIPKVTLNLINSNQTSSNLLEDQYIYQPEELASHDLRWLIRKIADFILSIFREIIFGLCVFPGMVFSWCCSRYDDCEKEKIWKEDSQGLYVLVHGLMSHPATWDKHRDKIMKEQPDHDLFIPYVPKKGNCTLEEAASPILEKILSYAEKCPNKPICLIGSSNGGRIVHHLEIELRLRVPQAKIWVSSIAGVHFGSTKMSAIRSNCLLRCLTGVSDSIAEELSFGSEKAQEILKAMQQPLPVETHRKYVFYGTPEDTLATNISTVFPKIGEDKSVEYISLYGYGHCSLIHGVCDDQIDRAKTWMQDTLEIRA